MAKMPAVVVGAAGCALRRLLTDDRRAERPRDDDKAVAASQRRPTQHAKFFQLPAQGDRRLGNMISDKDNLHQTHPRREGTRVDRLRDPKALRKACGVPARPSSRDYLCKLQNGVYS